MTWVAGLTKMTKLKRMRMLMKVDRGYDQLLLLLLGEYLQVGG